MLNGQYLRRQRISVPFKLTFLQPPLLRLAALPQVSKLHARAAAANLHAKRRPRDNEPAKR